MAEYVETGYSENYTEGDVAVVPPVVPVGTVPCDLTAVMELLNALVAKNAVLEVKLNDIKSIVNSNNFKLESLPTMEYINTQIPFVDDMGIKVLPAGTQVNVQGFGGVCTVLSSRYLPYEAYTYIIIYTVSYTVDGITRISDFSDSQVFEYVSPVSP
ncbi:MAG: hypothetical protein Q7S59_05890 [Sulfurimonas sp.]|nr:hypothetical protein [Sulfurimonas sp.]